MNSGTITQELFFLQYDLDPIVYVSSRLRISLSDDLAQLVEDIAPFAMDAVEAFLASHMETLGLYLHSLTPNARVQVNGQDIECVMEFSGVPSFDNKSIRSSVKAQLPELQELLSTSIKQGRAHYALWVTSRDVAAALCALYQWGKQHPTRSNVLLSKSYPIEVTRHTEKLNERGRTLFEAVLADITQAQWAQWPQTSQEEFENGIGSTIASTGFWS